MSSKIQKPAHYQLLDTPIGSLRLVSDGAALTKIEFPQQHSTSSDEIETTDPVLSVCATQLTEYFAGQRQAFSLPLNAGGTIFQNEVWSALTDIPFGELRSYSDIACAIGRPNAVRAVGAANGRNPLPIIVPCHRVIGSNGSLTGFAGGIPLKTKLLQLEGMLLL